MVRDQRKEIEEYVQTVNISDDVWVHYFEQLYKGRRSDTRMKNDVHIILDVTDAEVRAAVQRSRNRKSPEEDGISNELLKYSREPLLKQRQY